MLFTFLLSPGQGLILIFLSSVLLGHLPRNVSAPLNKLVAKTCEIVEFRNSNTARELDIIFKYIMYESCIATMWLFSVVCVKCSALVTGHWATTKIDS